MDQVERTAKKPEEFEAAQSKAEELAKDKERTRHLLREAVEKAKRNRKVLEGVWEDLQALFRLVKAWVRGDYPEVPWQTIVFAIASVVYFVNPFDFIPDFLPGSGFLDDATVVGFVIKLIKKDIEKFLDWEQEHVS